jgi:hypothetical protein
MRATASPFCRVLLFPLGVLFPRHRWLAPLKSQILAKQSWFIAHSTIQVRSTLALELKSLLYPCAAKR